MVNEKCGICKDFLELFAYLDSGRKAFAKIRRPKDYPQEPISTEWYVRRYVTDEAGVWEIHELFDETKLSFKYEDVLAEIKKSGRDGITDLELMERFKTPFKAHMSAMLEDMYKAGKIVVKVYDVKRPMTEEEIKLDREFREKLRLEPHTSYEMTEITVMTIKYYAEEHAMHLPEELRASLI